MSRAIASLIVAASVARRLRARAAGRAAVPVADGGGALDALARPAAGRHRGERARARHELARRRARARHREHADRARRPPALRSRGEPGRDRRHAGHRRRARSRCGRAQERARARPRLPGQRRLSVRIPLGPPTWRPSCSATPNCRLAPRRRVRSCRGIPAGARTPWWCATRTAGRCTCFSRARRRRAIWWARCAPGQTEDGSGRPLTKTSKPPAASSCRR